MLGQKVSSANGIPPLRPNAMLSLQRPSLSAQPGSASQVHPSQASNRGSTLPMRYIPRPAYPSQQGTNAATGRGLGLLRPPGAQQLQAGSQNPRPGPVMTGQQVQSQQMRTALPASAQLAQGILQTPPNARLSGMSAAYNQYGAPQAVSQGMPRPASSASLNSARAVPLHLERAR